MIKVTIETPDMVASVSDKDSLMVQDALAVCIAALYSVGFEKDSIAVSMGLWLEEYENEY